MLRSLLFTGALMLALGSSPSAAFGPDSEHKEGKGTKARVKDALADTDVAYGRVKELTAGQKIVIDVDNAPDKTFDLADKDLTVKMGKGLKVGDTVKINEHDVAGKTKSVTISKHSGGGVAHGDADPAAKKP